MTTNILNTPGLISLQNTRSAPMRRAQTQGAQLNNVLRRQNIRASNQNALLQQQQRNVLTEAGGLAAGGNPGAARDVTLRAGILDAAEQFGQMLANDNEQVAARKKQFVEQRGMLALQARQAGLNNQQYGEFLRRFGQNDPNPDIETDIVQAAGFEKAFEADRERRKLAAQEPTVTIADPSSPTGTRIVRRSEGVGQAGPQRQPLVQISNTQQKAEDQAFGKDLVSEFSEVRERAANAEQERTTLRLMLNTMRQEGFQTGKVEPLRTTLTAVAKGLGVPLSDQRVQQVVDAQTFSALGGQILANRLAAQKGPQTDRDADRMLETLASLDKEGEANDFLLRAGIALRSREIEQRDFFQDWRRERGTLDGAAQAWSALKDQVPLFGISPETGRPRFFTEFEEANSQQPFEEIVRVWNEFYVK